MVQSQQVLEWQQQARDEGWRRGQEAGEAKGILGGFRLAQKLTGSEGAALAAVVEQFGEEVRAILAKALGKAPE